MKRSEIEAILNNAEIDNATRLDQIMSIHGADANTWNQDRANLTKERDEARQAGNAHSDYDQIVAERDELRAYRDEREMSDRFAKVVSGAKFKNTYTEKGVMGDFVKALGDDQNKGKTDEEIIVTREKAIAALREKGYEIVNTLFTDEWYGKEAMEKRGVVQIPLCFLAKSLENMSLCHAAYFCKGWENARGCRIEHDAAVAYGLEIIYEE